MFGKRTFIQDTLNIGGDLYIAAVHVACMGLCYSSPHLICNVLKTMLACSSVAWHGYHAPIKRSIYDYCTTGLWIVAIVRCLFGAEIDNCMDDTVFFVCTAYAYDDYMLIDSTFSPGTLMHTHDMYSAFLEGYNGCLIGFRYATDRLGRIYR